MDHSERYISVDSHVAIPLDRESVTASVGVHSRAFAARLRRLLGMASFRYWLALTAVLCLLPTLRTGLVFDDMFHRLAVQGRLRGSVGPLDLFDFIPGDPARRHALQEQGFPGWWLGPHTRVSYFRPLASLTHFLDYSAWSGAPWAMHLENVALYAGVVVAAAAFYRRFIDTRWMAGLASLLYGFDHAHAAPVAWIANRSALLATLFGLLCVVQHDRWRRAGRRLAGLLAYGFFVLALLSAESGVAIGGYLVAHAVCIDRGRPARRLLVVAPYVLIAAAWRVVYSALGHGILGSGVNSDPLHAPLSFALRAAQTVPLLLGASFTAIPSDLLMAAPGLTPFAAALAAVVVVGFVWACLPLVRGVPSSRFFALGAVLSTVPFGGMLATERYLFWTGLGVMGLLAQVAAVPAITFHSRSARWLCMACLGMRFFVSPVLFPVGALGPSFWRANLAPIVTTFPGNAATAQKTVVLVNAPSDLVAAYVPMMAEDAGGTPPAHVYLLHSGLAEVRVHRDGARSIEVDASRGWMPGPLDRTLRAEPFHPGEKVDLERMSARVESVLPDGRADAVRFSFPVELEDRSLAFLTWGSHGLEAFSPPPVGATTTLSPPAVLLSRN
jgi:hypothetical protein